MPNKYFFCFLVLSLFLLNPNLLIAQSENEVVATVNGKKITQNDIDNSVIGQLFPLRQQIYTIRSIALENLIIKTLLENEARNRGISIEELKASLTTGKIEISSNDVEKSYLENVSAFASMNPEEAKERIRLDLETQARMRMYQAAIQKLKEDANIEKHVDDGLLPTVSVNTNGPKIGSNNAKITIVAFSDFRCPFCRQSAGTIKQILQNYGDKVNMIFKHLPLQPKSMNAAQVSVCADEQGRFWDYHDSLFASEDFSDEAFIRLAEKLNLNIPGFKDCMTSARSRTIILKDMEEAKRLGIDSTPNFIINGKLVRGAITFEDFNRFIETELKNSQKMSIIRNSQSGGKR